MDFTGTSGDDTITGTTGDDLFKVFQGGNDTVSGLTGRDVFNFAGTLTAADKIDGGGGQDTVQIKGDYSAGIVFNATTMVNVETLTVGAGFNYTITTDDATLPTYAVLTINATGLAAPNWLAFNGSNESDGGLFHVHGGAGNDTIGMGANMITGDHFDGGDGFDELIIGNGLIFQSLTIRNIEEVQLLPTFNDGITFNSSNVPAGQTIEIDASGLTGSSYYTVNAHNIAGNAVFDGSPREAKLYGGSGDDTFNMGANFSRADRIDGGTGNDTLNLDGGYNLILSSGTIANISEMTLAGGHNYNITSFHNVASGQTMTVNATGLTASDSLVLNFSSEGVGSVIVDFGAALVNVEGGHQGDAFDFSVTSQGGLTALDHIDGEGGNDRLYLDGDYTGAHALVLNSGTVINVEEFDFNAGHSYTLTTDDATVASGQTLTVNASALSGANVLTFDGSAETNGRFAITGGSGNDVLKGGAGADSFTISSGGNHTIPGGGGADTITDNPFAGSQTFIYNAVSDSIGANYDHIAGVNYDNDIFHVSGIAGAVTGVDTAITTGALSAASFDSDLAAAIGAGQLAAHHAVAFTPDSGDLANRAFLIIDENGTAGYQAGQDLVIWTQIVAGTLTTADFT
jgi:hypothetical protein